MKILVYNFRDQFALSRTQIEIIKKILPEEYFASIKEFHITWDSMGQEKFEYNYGTKVAYFEYPVKQKTNEIIEDAIKTLLIGLARIKSKDKFGHYISKNILEELMPFIDEWLPKCIKAIKSKP